MRKYFVAKCKFSVTKNISSLKFVAKNTFCCSKDSRFFFLGISLCINFCYVKIGKYVYLTDISLFPFKIGGKSFFEIWALQGNSLVNGCKLRSGRGRVLGLFFFFFFLLLWFVVVASGVTVEMVEVIIVVVLVFVVVVYHYFNELFILF